MVTNTYISVKAALPHGENPLPFFRDPQHDTPVFFEKEVPEEYKQLPGLDCGFRMLPYLKQDRYDRNRKQTDLKAVILENSHLKATILPTLGGRMISLYSKDEERELLYDNRNIQVANLANRDAWFAGGVEWNIGQYGHAFSTCSPVCCTKISDDHIRLSGFERCKRLWWHIDLALPEESRFLRILVTIENKEEQKQSLYYWTNTACYQDKDTRVFASNKQALYLDTLVRDKRLYGMMESPTIPMVPDIDASYPTNFPVSDEYFFTCNHDAMPWEACMQKGGKGFLEASTPFLAYRKMFCWGHGKGGENWQRFLSPEREGEYVEIQAGLAPSQLHGLWIEGKTSVSWLQVMGAVSAKETGTYDTARQHVSDAVASLLSPSMLNNWKAEMEKKAKEPYKEMLQNDNGWAYLESTAAGIPTDETPYKESDVPEELKPWLILLKEKKLPEYDPLHLPPVLGNVWENNINNAMGDRSTKAYYLGLIKAEEGKTEEALSLFLSVHALKKDAMSARNIALLSQGDEKLLWYQKAAESKRYFDDPAIAEEYIALCLKKKNFSKANAMLELLPSTLKTERMALYQAEIDAKKGNTEHLEAFLKGSYPFVREGECPLDELWTALQFLLYAPEKEHTKEETKKLLKEHPLPDRLTFEMFKDEQ